MKIAIIGATGFIGRRLTEILSGQGEEVVAITRDVERGRILLPPGIDIKMWNAHSVDGLREAIAGATVVINLAGESIAGGTWTKARKKKLVHSRVETGRLLSEAILEMDEKPRLLLQGSAVGYYGTSVEDAAGENHPAGAGFLAELTHQWESSVGVLEETGVKIIFLRTGVVLGRSGGMLAKMLPSFQYYAGSIPGSGKQWISWIHIEDLCRAISHVIHHPVPAGPCNLVSPTPVRMGNFIKTISVLTGKPAWLKIPGPFIKALLGKMGRETILASQNIYPEKLLKTGFEFRFPEVEAALADILQDDRK